jgi:hypothetical protein
MTQLVVVIQFYTNIFFINSSLKYLIWFPSLCQIFRGVGDVLNNSSQIIYSASSFPSAILTTVPFEKYYKLNSKRYGIKKQPSPEFLT